MRCSARGSWAVLGMRGTARVALHGSPCASAPPETTAAHVGCARCARCGGGKLAARDAHRPLRPPWTLGMRTNSGRGAMPSHARPSGAPAAANT